MIKSAVAENRYVLSDEAENRADTIADAEFVMITSVISACCSAYYDVKH